MNGKYDDISDTVMIEINHLSKIYRLYRKPIDRLKESISLSHKCYSKEHYALQDIDLKIFKGESIGIIGANGSGKSTLLKIITGVLTPSGGQVKTFGKISALLELGAGFNPEYTGMENIYLNGTMMGYSKEEMEKKIPSIVAFADIGDFINQPVKTYSSGMFARLAFAVSVSVEPDILVVDEALSVGDMRFQIKCMRRMKMMMQGGTTVLFVSHDINAVRRFCTKALWLRNGRMTEYGNVNEVSDHYMDFLKIGEDTNENKKQELTTGNHMIAEIISFELLDEQGMKVSAVQINQPVKVEVCYRVYDKNIENPVVGIAIRGMDDDYVCGLNSLLDKQEVPWDLGINTITLAYPYGILAIGGSYYFDVALYDQTATVPLQYISVVKKFTVHSGYVGEGRFIIPHKWS